MQLQTSQRLFCFPVTAYNVPPNTLVECAKVSCNHVYRFCEGKVLTSIQEQSGELSWLKHSFCSWTCMLDTIPHPMLCSA